MEPAFLPTRIETSRLSLRRHSLELAETMFQCVDGDRQRLREFLPWVDGTRTVEDTAKYIRSTLEAWDKGTGFDYGIFDRESGAYMGNLGLHAIQWEHECCEMGYWILGVFEGRGFMSEAVSALEQACFSLGFHRVEIRCSSKNQRSAAVPARLGYHLDGTLRGNAIEYGEHRDTRVFGKLRTDP